MLKDGLTINEWETLQAPLSTARGNPDIIARIIRVNDKRIAAIRAENKKFTPHHKPTRGPSVISDDLGVKGLLNHANGRMYDSKSEFRNATKRAGCVEVGTQPVKEWKTPTERGVQGDFNVAPALKEALQKHGVK